MVVVKVRETYDLHTTKNKMTVIAVHTPKPDIIKRSYPGLLMQCKMYRPLSADVKIACASMMPLDPLGIGTSAGDVAPEDVFNPILYKAMSNKGMSQLEARINSMNTVPPSTSTADVHGDSALVEVDDFTSLTDEFGVYYALLSNTHEWKHANPQAGLEMRDLRPLVYEVLYNVGDNYGSSNSGSPVFSAPDKSFDQSTVYSHSIVGSAKPMPFINCTAYTNTSQGSSSSSSYAVAGFPASGSGAYPVYNAEVDVPWINIVCGAIIIPPSRLHELFFRMVVEWSIEFSQIRPIQDVTTLNGLGLIGNTTHYQNYSYSSTKEALTGSTDTILENEACMVSSNVDVEKVM